jgi:voltage-gated potassium channel
MRNTLFDRWWADKRLVAVVSTMLGLIAVGTVTYHYLEHWSWVSSFYFTVCTITTVGYGDLYPTTEFSQLFTALYALAGVALGLASLGLIGGMYIARREEVLTRKRGPPSPKDET